MPPKRVALLQAIRDSFTEEQSAATIEQWANSIIPKLDEQARSAHQLRGSVSAAAASPSATPGAIVTALEGYQTTCHDIYMGAQTIRTVISTRIPEYKEEDNLGVAVQMSVLKLLDGIEGRVLGGGGGDEKSAPACSNIFALKSYLSARAAVEDKLLGKPSEEKNEEKASAATAGGSKSPSALLELRQVDVDALLKLELAAAQTATQLRAFVNAYVLNWKKLIQPRVSNDRMVS